MMNKQKLKGPLFSAQDPEKKRCSFTLRQERGCKLTVHNASTLSFPTHIHLALIFHFPNLEQLFPSIGITFFFMFTKHTIWGFYIIHPNTDSLKLSPNTIHRKHGLLP